MEPNGAFSVVVLVLTIVVLVFSLACCVWMCVTERRSVRVNDTQVAMFAVVNPIRVPQFDSESLRTGSVSSI
jgi:hypothetical protein